MYKLLFCILKQLYRKRPGMTMSCAKLPQNISKNRYRDISPCEYHCMTFLGINYGRRRFNPNEFLLFFYQMMQPESSWKARMTISMQITSMWVAHNDFIILHMNTDSQKTDCDLLPHYVVLSSKHLQMEIPASSLINRYIACQGPLPNTCPDFWQMTWEQGSSMVVMLTTQVERGRVRATIGLWCFYLCNA